jgi:hypothetical protein
MHLVFGSGGDSLGKMPTNVAASRLSKKREKPELEMMCSREWSKCERFTRWASFFGGYTIPGVLVICLLPSYLSRG